MVYSIKRRDSDGEEAVLRFLSPALFGGGAGKLTKRLQITGELNRTSILGDELWIEDDGFVCNGGRIYRDWMNDHTALWADVELD